MEEIKGVIDVLREQNRHFRSVEKKHTEFDQILQEMSRRKVLTPQEEVQKKIFQKEKLAAKDDMMEMARLYIGSEKTEKTSAHRPSS